MATPRMRYDNLVNQIAILKKKSAELNAKKQQFALSYQNELMQLQEKKKTLLKNLNVLKAEIEGLISDAKEHYKGYSSLKGVRLVSKSADIDMPMLRALRLKIDDYSTNDLNAKRLYEYAIELLKIVNSEIASVDSALYKDKSRIEQIYLSGNKSITEQTDRIRKEYINLSQGEDIQQLKKGIESVRKYAESPMQFWAGGAVKEPKAFYFGEAARPMDFPTDKEITNKVTSVLGDIYDEDKRAINYPVYIEGDKGSSTYLLADQLSEDSLNRKINEILANIIRLFPLSESRILYIDPVTFNMNCLGALKDIAGESLEDIIVFPKTSARLKSCVSEFENQCIDSQNEKLTFIVLKGYPERYDYESRDTIERLYANRNYYHLAFLFIDECRVDEKNKTFEKKTIKSNSKYIIATKTGFKIWIKKSLESYDFRWYKGPQIIAQDEISKIKKKNLKKVIGTRYLEVVNPAYPPQYKRGNRHIIWPYGIDSKGNVRKQSMEGTTFATFLTGAPGSGKTSLLMSLINHIVMNYHPDDVEIWIMDLKGSTEIVDIAEHCPPHIKYLLTPKSEVMIYSFLDRILEEHHRRIKILNNLHIPKALDVPADIYFPSIFVIIDEVSIMSQAIIDSTTVSFLDDYKNKLQNILSLTRGTGFHFIFANQTYNGGKEGFSNQSMENIMMRMAMKTSPQGIKDTLDISSAYWNDQQKAWAANLPPFEVMVGTKPEDGAPPTIEKLKTLFLNKDDLKLQNKRFDGLTGLLTQRDDTGISVNNTNTYVNKHTIVYAGKKEKFEDKKDDMLSIRKVILNRYGCDKDLVLFPGRPMSLRRADPVILKNGENENILMLADENRYGNMLSDLIFSCLKSLRYKKKITEIWAAKNSELYTLYSHYWKHVDCFTDEKDICTRIRKLSEAVYNQNPIEKVIFIFKPSALIHQLKKSIDFAALKKKHETKKAPGTDTTELEKELSMDSLFSILGTEKPAVPTKPSVTKDRSDDSLDIFDIGDDLKTLCQWGSEMGIHFVFVENSYTAFKKTGVKNEYFKHYFSIGLIKDEALNIPLGTPASKTKDNLIFYTDSKQYKTYENYEH
jgi:hypothetical protein